MNISVAYVVIDTNVLVSALITRNMDSPTVEMLRLLTEGRIIPVYSTEILNEYEEVLKRPKFNLSDEIVCAVIKDIKTNGVEVTKIPKIDEEMTDPKDTVFYTVALALKKENSYLVTGNSKHFPIKPFIVNPAQLLEIIKMMK